MKSDYGNKWLSESLLKWGELKNRKWDLNEHLILALDLKLSQPLDLGIPQKSLRVRLKEENESKDHSFFHEQIERGGEKAKDTFLSSEKKDGSSKEIQQIRTASSNTKLKASGTNFEEWKIAFIAVSFSRIVQQQGGTEIEDHRAVKEECIFWNPYNI